MTDIIRFVLILFAVAGYFLVWGSENPVWQNRGIAVIAFVALSFVVFED